jgi:small GTP-binding protein
VENGENRNQNNLKPETSNIKVVFMQLRNIAIIAHVDHGKTTLVDNIIRSTKVFRDNQDAGELIMDSNDLEKERGITIFSKNMSVVYNDVKINVIDTPVTPTLAEKWKGYSKWPMGLFCW